jgi:MFS family permease
MLIPAVSNGVFVTCFPLWVVPWVDEFHVPRGTVMTGFAIGNLVCGLAAPIVGRSLERVPARLSVALGALAMAVGFFLASQSWAVWQVSALYASLMAVGAAFTGMLTAQSVAVRILPHKAGTISGFITLSMSAGGVVMPALLAGPVAALGWRPAFLLAGAIVLLIVGPAGWFLLKGYGIGPVAMHGAHGGGAHGGTFGGTAATEVDASQLTLRALLRNLAFWIPLIAIVPILFVVGTVLTNVVAIAADSGIAVGVGGYLVPMIGLGGAVGSVSLGWLADRVDYRLVYGATATAVLAALLLLMGRLAVLPMAVAFGIIGFAGAGVFPVLGVILVRNFGPRAFARIMGTIMPVLVIEMALAPVLAARVRDLTGSYKTAFAYCACLLVASALTVVTLRIGPAKPGVLPADLPRHA